MDSKAPTLTDGRGDQSTIPSSAPSFVKEHRSDSDSTTDREDVSIHGPVAADPELGEKEEQATEPDNAIYPTGFKMAAIVVALVLAIFLVSLDLTIVGTAIPAITEDFKGLDLIAWYGSAFFLTFAAFQSTWGKAYKYFPLKITFLMSLFVFELGSLLCGVAPNSTALIVGRAIAGLGGAGVASGSYVIIAFSARPQMRAAFTGIIGASYGVASVIGPLLGGVFAEKSTWRWCFYINLPIGGVAGAIIFIFFTTPPQAVPVQATLKEKFLQMDFPGTIVAVASIVCFILAMQWGGVSKTWGSGPVVGTLVASIVLLGVLFAVQWYQGERAMIVGRILKNRTVAVGMFAVFFIGGGFFLLLYYLPLYFQVVSGVSASQSGVRNLPLIIATTIATILSGGLISGFGHFVPIAVIGTAIGTVGNGLLYTLGVGSSSSHWIGYQVVAGFGLGLAFQIPIISTQAVVAPEDLASATAMILFVQAFGGAYLISAGEAAFANTVIRKIPEYVPGLDGHDVIHAGIANLRTAFQGDVLNGVIHAYMDALKVDYAIAIVCAGIALIGWFASEWPWRNLKGKVVVGAA